ncbi:MAG: hypothetical protein KDK70_08795 [Myxococcales bacterium]|nr:hypothetical protein [Myxococcales bacterium]
MPDPASLSRIRRLAGHGLAASLAAIVVMLIFGAGTHPVIALGGLVLVSGVFAALVIDPRRALVPAAARRALPPSRRAR